MQFPVVRAKAAAGRELLPQDAIKEAARLIRTQKNVLLSGSEGVGGMAAEVGGDSAAAAAAAAIKWKRLINLP